MQAAAAVNSASHPSGVRLRQSRPALMIPKTMDGNVKSKPEPGVSLDELFFSSLRHQVARAQGPRAFNWSSSG